MQLRKSPRRQVGAPALAALLLALALTPASAPAVASRSAAGELSPRLAELAKPSIRSAPAATQAEALDLPPSGPGSLLRDEGRVLVEVRLDRGAAGLEGLRAAGAQIVDVSQRYGTVTASAGPGDLRALAEVPGVAGVSPVLTPIASASTCPAGIAVSEGNVQLRAAEARSAFGVDGSGVTVGVLSDSFDQATEAADESGDPVATHEADDVESGDLPGAGNTCAGQATPVDVLDDSDAEGEDEGRAMAQIVHDVAPRADLAFASAFSGLTAFASNVRALAAAGAGVIVDDVSYFEEPFFQEGPVGVAVTEVSEDGVSYFSSAGNNNLIDAFGRDIASWEAPAFRNVGSCPAGLPSFAKQCMDFDPGAGVDPTFGIRVSPGAALDVDLQWAQPWSGVSTDLDAYLLSAADAVVAKSEEFNVVSTQRPFEFVSWENTTGTAQTVRFVVDRCVLAAGCTGGGDAGTPRLKLALLQNGGGVTETEYPESIADDTIGPTIFGHNGAKDAISMAAIRFNASGAPESYSSRGPVTHYFGPVNGVIAASSLPQPEVLSKPDVTASDCVATTFFAFFAIGHWRFCGTSAAAPHAAGVAALMLDKSAGAEPEDVRLALKRSASPIGGSLPCAVGAGLVNAVGAIEELLAPGSGEPPACTRAWVVLGQETIEPVFVPVAPDGEIPNPEPAPKIPTPPALPSPQTFFLHHPPKVIRTRGRTATATFRLGSDEEGVAFLCRFDRTGTRICPAKIVRRFGLGFHALRIRARNTNGIADQTPAVFRFRVKRAG
jgi:hypothetical protein